jgi:hypothetical protein
MRVFGFRLRRRGTPLPGATLFVANHVSWIDIVALHSQRMMGFVAKREISRWPLVGWLATRGETIYHERGTANRWAACCTRCSRACARGVRSACSRRPHARRARDRAVPRAHLPGRGRSRRAVQPVALRYGKGRARNRWSPSGRARASPPISCACSASRRAWRKCGSSSRSMRPTRAAAAASPNLARERIIAAMEAALMGLERGLHAPRASLGSMHAPACTRPRLRAARAGCAARTCSRCWARARCAAAAAGALEAHRRHTTAHIIDAGDGVRLQGLHSALPGQPSRGWRCCCTVGKAAPNRATCNSPRRACSHAGSTCSG